MSNTPGLFLFVLSISNAAGYSNNAAASACPQDIHACKDRESVTELPRLHAGKDSLIVEQKITKLRFHIDTPAGIVHDDPDVFNEGISFKDAFAPANLATIEMHADTGITDYRTNGMMWRSGYFPVVSLVPTIHIVGRSISWFNDTSAVLRGYMTIGKTTRHVEFNLELAYSPADDSRKGRVGLKARTTVLRSEFGMTALAPLLHDDVKLCIRFEAARDRPNLSLVKSA